MTTVIVGAGAIGLSCGYELAQRGEPVVVVEKGRLGRACSEGNAGWITPSLSEPVPAPGLVSTSLKWMLSKDSPLYIAPSAVPGLARWLFRFWRHCNRADFLAGFRATSALNRLTLPLFDELAADGFPIELHRRGLLFTFLNRKKSEAVRANFSVLGEYGYRMPEPLDGDALRALEPVLSDAVSAGFLVDHEYHVRPETLSLAYAERIRALGGEVREEVEVLGPARDNGRVAGVETSAGSIPARRILIAAGAWSGRVAERFGVRLPVTAGKGYSFTVSAPPRFSRPLYLGEVKVGSTPFEGAYRFAGTMELSGVNERMDRRRIDGIRRVIGRYFREPVADGASREWVGMRPMTPDGLPLLGQVAGRENLFVATGHAMLGITLAPATGRVMSELMIGTAPSAPIAPFAPGRFNW
ncbi:MAG: NAD(P)/FAD-dependent oxidoreductase [Gemmatimonadales bacterium]